jgi:hypothetical protein
MRQRACALRGFGKKRRKKALHKKIRKRLKIQTTGHLISSIEEKRGRFPD